MASTDARPVPIKNTAFRAVFPILDADGDLVTGATSLDSEVSKDQGTFADCTNEATEIATSSGMYYLDLTSTEMNADCVAVIVKTASSGAKTTVLVLYPNEAGDIDVDVTSIAGSATAATNLFHNTTSMKLCTVTNAGFSPTATQFETADVTEATADHLINRLVVWRTGNLSNGGADSQIGRVTAYALNTGRGRFTVTAQTEAPANGDTFLIV